MTGRIVSNEVFPLGFQEFLAFKNKENLFSENIGRIFENVVYLALRRKGEEVFYWKGKGEVDFLVRKGTKIDRLINVCWELNKNNEKRELSSLCEAMEQFNLADAQIIVSGYDDRVKIKGKKIVITNFFSWLKKGN
ncbi:MAG: ATP-binding protein [Deltaproteobacteria bacterium]|nr:ATP-binding protein [Deltaproteobacteria bacterium]MBW1794021.1 ATP-binding protein [Deltaproteobacteria bacterium]MBW2330305.1 ATP-binding protein [Deltaproteobacteria bacterium]